MIGVDLFYGGESVSADTLQSFTCPFCGRMGLTESSLHSHVSSEHASASNEVICAICASLPGGEPNNVTDDFASHLTIEHRNPRDAEEPQTAVRGRRAPHPSRSSLNSSRPRRGQPQYSVTSIVQGPTGSSGTTSGCIAPSREMDPIAELLSQLSGVRRAANLSHSNSAQFHQLQMQLHLDRHIAPPAPRSTFASPSQSIVDATSSSSTRSGVNAPMDRVVRRHQHHHQQNHHSAHHSSTNSSSSSQMMSSLASNSGVTSDVPYVVLMDHSPSMNTVFSGTYSSNNNGTFNANGKLTSLFSSLFSCN